MYFTRLENENPTRHKQFRYGGAEKLLLETVPKYSGTTIAMDVLVLNGIEYPFYVDFQKNKENKIILSRKIQYLQSDFNLKMMPYLKKYDVIHVHLFPSLYWVALAKMLSFSSVKLVYTEHSTQNRRNKSTLFQF